MPPGSNPRLWGSPPPDASPYPPPGSAHPPYTMPSPLYPADPYSPSALSYSPSPSPQPPDYPPQNGAPPLVPWWTTARPRIERRRWLPVLAVAAIIAAIVLGGVALDGAIAAPSIGTIGIGNGATIEGAPGWVWIDDPANTGVATLEKGDAHLLVASDVDSGSDPRWILEAYLQAAGSWSDTAQITFGSIESSMIGGRPAAAVTFNAVASVPIDGELLVIVAGKVTVLFDAVAPAGDLELVAGDITQMAASIEVSP